MRVRTRVCARARVCARTCVCVCARTHVCACARTHVRGRAGALVDATQLGIGRRDAAAHAVGVGRDGGCASLSSERHPRHPRRAHLGILGVVPQNGPDYAEYGGCEIGRSSSASQGIACLPIQPKRECQATRRSRVYVAMACLPKPPLPCHRHIIAARGVALGWLPGVAMRLVGVTGLA